MKSKTLLLVCLLAMSSSSIAQASTISIETIQDVSLDSPRPNENWNNVGHPYLWVGDNNITGFKDDQGMFGFDVTDLTDLLGVGETLTINSMTFRAYNNFQPTRDGSGNEHDGNVDISLGLTDAWDANAVTYANSANNHGATISSTFLTVANVGHYVSWNVATVGAAPLLDGYVTFYLTIVPNAQDGAFRNYHTFEREDAGGSNPAYLDIDYTINPQPVPEPSSLMLMGIGGLCVKGYRRWNRTSRS